MLVRKSKRPSHVRYTKTKSIDIYRIYTHVTHHVYWWSYFDVFPAFHACSLALVAPGSCLCMLSKREQYLTPKSVQTVWCCSYIPRLAPWFRSPATQSTLHGFCGWFDSFLNACLEVQGAWLCSALMRLAVANPKVETLCLFLPFLTCCLQFLFQDGAW